MPRKKPAVHSYSVYIMAWASQEIKERVARGQDILSRPEQLAGRTLYLGSSERSAAWHFYKAAQEAMTDPLAISVSMRRDSRDYIRLTP